MKRNGLHRTLMFFVFLTLASMIGCSCISETEGASLPLNYLDGGRKPDPEGWVFDGENPVSYEDSTIRVAFEREVITHELYCGNRQGEIAEDESWIVRIRISDASQLRTAISLDTYDGNEAEDAEAMANRKNAVVAIDGDFLKLFDDVGYVVRQGKLIRDDTDNSRGFVYDMLLIDSEGDFHVVNSATTENINAYVAEYLTPQGRTILNTFNCGPVLVQDGRVPMIAQSEAALNESYEWRYPCQRQCIVQTGPLEYAIVEVAGEGGETTGFTMTEFAEYVAEKFPDAILAYNLAGGHATSLIAWKSAENARGERICFTPTPKQITDMLYFASAEE